MPYIGEKLSAAGKVQNMEGVELQLDADGDTGITADTDDQIDIKIGGTDIVKIESDGDTRILSTTDSTAAGPIITLARDRDNAQANDLIGRIIFEGSRLNSASQTDYVSIHGKIESSHTQDGEFHIDTAISGTLTNQMYVGDSGAVFNDGGVSTLDFRVESDDKTHALFVDSVITM